MRKLLYIFLIQLCHDVFARLGYAQWRYTNYHEYIHSKRWWRQRVLRLLIDDFTCQRCGAVTHKLHVHHECYDNLGIEPTFDLVTLCAACHAEVHAELDRMKESA